MIVLVLLLPTLALSHHCHRHCQLLPNYQVVDGSSWFDVGQCGFVTKKKKNLRRYTCYVAETQTVILGKLCLK